MSSADGVKGMSPFGGGGRESSFCMTDKLQLGAV